jgi:hypothetical protein
LYGGLVEHRKPDSPEIRYARFACWVVETAIAARVLLAALGANPRAGFICLLDALTELLVMPFAGVFSAPSDGVHTLELSSLVAMGVYAVLTWGTIWWLRCHQRHPQHEHEP